MVEGSGFDLYLWLTDPDPEGPKTYAEKVIGTIINYQHILALYKRNSG
jgi:hypothetical protein